MSVLTKPKTAKYTPSSIDLHPEYLDATGSLAKLQHEKRRCEAIVAEPTRQTHHVPENVADIQGMVSPGVKLDAAVAGNQTDKRTAFDRLQVVNEAIHSQKQHLQQTVSRLSVDECSKSREAYSAIVRSMVEAFCRAVKAARVERDFIGSIQAAGYDTAALWPIMPAALTIDEENLAEHFWVADCIREGHCTAAEVQGWSR